MATCEELTAQIAALQAAIVVDDAQITAAQLQKSADQTNLWIAYMNYCLQGCGTVGPMATAESVAAANVPAIADLLNPAADLLAIIEACPARSLLLKLAKLYWGDK